MNLVLNARDAMPTGGVVSVEVRNIVLDDGFPDKHARGKRHVLVTVSDTGVGMSKDLQARVFEPFFTTKPPGRGSGLGLATVRNIVQECGGRITIVSEPGKGTSVRLYLPAVSG
jgi:signal transduction histidine kinase